MSPEAFDHLIDAERDALSRSGESVGKIALIKALREATGIGLREAKDAVDDYLVRRSGGPLEERGAGWIDGLLDAERAGANREDRPITRITLIKSVREASGLGLKEAADAVDDYLRRRGGKGLQADPNIGCSLVGFLILVATIAAGVAFAWTRS